MKVESNTFLIASLSAKHLNKDLMMLSGFSRLNVIGWLLGQELCFTLIEKVSFKKEVK